MTPGFFENGPLSRIGKPIGSGGAKERKERIRKLYEAVEDLTKTLASTEARVTAVLTSVDPDTIDKLRVVLTEIKPALAEISSKLDETNLNLKKLSGNTTLLQLAFSGGGQELLEKMVSSIDGLNKVLKKGLERLK